jgi:hypothetical protein
VHVLFENFGVLKLTLYVSCAYACACSETP